MDGMDGWMDGLLSDGLGADHHVAGPGPGHRLGRVHGPGLGCCPQPAATERRPQPARCSSLAGLAPEQRCTAPFLPGGAALAQRRLLRGTA